MKQDNIKKQFRVSFKDDQPVKARFWDYAKNKLNPDQVSKVDDREFWFICEANHSFKRLPKSINRYGSWCDTCINLKKSEEPREFSVSFKDAHPIQASHWDYNKNTCAPDEVGQWDPQKFWFICKNQHSFNQKLSAISGLDRWCRFCGNQEVIYENSIAYTHPEIARQWHPTKNKKTASEVSIGSNTKYWWLCPEGPDHEWEIQPHVRKRAGCSICGGHTVIFSSSLAGMCPELLSEIDFEKTDVDPAKIYYQTTRRLPWRCKHGHEWEAPVRRRTKYDSGCRKCTSQTSSPEIRVYTEFKALFPDSESRHKIERKEIDVFIPSLNVAIEYDGSYFHKNKKKSDEQKAKIIENHGLILIRLRENPLPCSKMDVQVPKERDHLAPSHILEALKLILTFQPNIVNVAQAYEANNEFIAEEEYRRILSYLPGPPLEDSLAEKNPAVSEEWNYKKNYPLTPQLFHPNSGKKVWWICADNHEWETTIDKRCGNEKSKGRNCPYCSNKIVGYGNSLAETYPQVAKWWFQLLNDGVTPSDVAFGSGGKYWFTCKNNHVRKRRVLDLTTRGTKCGHCPGKGRGRRYTPPKELDGIE
jgi:hypothetical protein